jgi:hypothetical protein
MLRSIPEHNTRKLSDGAASLLASVDNTASTTLRAGRVQQGMHLTSLHGCIVTRLHSRKAGRRRGAARAHRGKSNDVELR